LNAIHDFARRRTRGADILGGLADAIEAAGVEAGGTIGELRAVADRTRRGRFHVLLIGCFSSGKSTLLNALLGEPVLPVKVNPCTAILTEIVHGPSPEVEVRGRDGSSRTLGVPAFLAEFQLQTPEPSEAGHEIDRFAAVDRAVLSYPLPLLEDGVVLLDTPGLDDDDARTARTLGSLPEADAVIVVLNASRFLTDLERRILRRELLPRGLTNLFFPVTMFDLIGSLSDDPAREIRELGDRARRTLGPLCEVDGIDRFDERFFPLDARGALRARYDREAHARRPVVDEATLETSQIRPFEASLQRFLVDERGRAQLGHLVVTAKRVRADLARRAELDRATADGSAEELRRRQEELLPKFRDLDAIARRVARIVEKFVERQKVAVVQDLRAFLARTEAELPEAIAGFDLGNTAGLDLFTAAGRARIESRLREQLDAWLAGRVAAWQKEVRPKLEDALDDLRVEMAGESKDFDEAVRGIVADFAGGMMSLDVKTDADEPAAAERWFAVALGAVLLSPGTMAAGWVEGYEGALKGATGRLGVRLALVALGALLGPIGWAGLILYVVTDAVLLVLTGGGQLRKLREQVAEGLRGKLVAQVDERKDAIAERVSEALAPLRDGIAGAAAAEARALEQQLDRTIAAREAAVRDAQGRKTAWDAALGAVEAGIVELEALL
jgi:hypothetical protein